MPDRWLLVHGTLAGDQPRAGAVGRIVIDLAGFPFQALSVPPGTPMAADGTEVLFACCSSGCTKDLRLAALVDAFQRTGDLPDKLERLGDLRIAPRQGTRSPADERARDLRWDEALASLGISPLHGACSWCLRTIGNGASSVSLAVTLAPHVQLASQQDGGVAFSIAGRAVPGVLRPAGAEDAPQGQLLVVDLCSQECADALVLAIREDGGASVVH